MTNEELVELIQKETNRDARTELIGELWQQNYRFVCKTVLRYKGLADTDDLIQEAYLGFASAVERFSLEVGGSFLTYCEYWLRQSVFRYIQRNKSVSTSYGTSDNIRQYRAAVSTLKKQLGRTPSLQELARYLGMSVKRVADIELYAYRDSVSSIDAIIAGEDGDITLGDTIASGQDLEYEVLESVFSQQVKEALWDTVDQLQEEEAAVLRHKFIDEFTLKEIGECFGYTPERARVVIGRALRNIRPKAKKNPTLWEYAQEQIANSRGYTNCGFRYTFTSSTERLALENLGEWYDK